MVNQQVTDNFVSPKTSEGISVEDLKVRYFLKTELEGFCKELNISHVGSKGDLLDRLIVFLETGVVKKPKPYNTPPKQADTNLSLDTVITESHRCSQNVRYFFGSVIHNFHFSTFIQKYFKENVGKTYQDVVNAWYEEEERKKDPNYKPQIAPQFKFNQFIRDFFEDPQNRGKTRKEAIDLWNKAKSQPTFTGYNKDLV